MRLRTRALLVVPLLAAGLLAAQAQPAHAWWRGGYGGYGGGWHGGYGGGYGGGWHHGYGGGGGAFLGGLAAGALVGGALGAYAAPPPPVYYAPPPTYYAPPPVYYAPPPPPGYYGGY